MKTFSLKLTGAIALGGELKRPGEVVDVAEDVAKNLLHRGKAVPASDDDGQAPAPAPAPADADGDEGKPEGDQAEGGDAPAPAPAAKPAAKTGKRK